MAEITRGGIGNFLTGVLQGAQKAKADKEKEEREQYELKLKERMINSRVKLEEFQGQKLQKEIAKDPRGIIQQLMDWWEQSQQRGQAQEPEQLSGPPPELPAPSMLRSRITETDITNQPSGETPPAPMTRRSGGPREALTGAAGMLPPGASATEEGLTLRSPLSQRNVRSVQFPDGSVGFVEDIFNPGTQQTQTRPIEGLQPLPPERTRNISQLIQNRYGLKPGTPPFQFAFGELIGAESFLPEDQRQFVLDKLDKTFLGTSGVGSTIEQSQQRKAQERAIVTTAEERAKLGTKPVSGERATKIINLSSAERQGQLAMQLFQPQFVGKGFQAFASSNKKVFENQAELADKGRYVPGALAGNLRQFFGDISPEETTFRRTVLDVQDIILRARSGLQINEHEFKRIKGFLFHLLDEPSVFVPSMNRLVKEVGQMIDDTLKTEITPASELLRGRQKGKTQSGSEEERLNNIFGGQ